MRKPFAPFRGTALSAAVLVAAALAPAPVQAQTSSSVPEPTTATTAAVPSTTSSSSAPTTVTTAAPTTTAPSTAPTTVTTSPATTVTTTAATTATTATPTTTANPTPASSTSDRSLPGWAVLLIAIAAVGLFILGRRRSREAARQNAEIARWDGRRETLLVEARGVDQSIADLLARPDRSVAEQDAAWHTLRLQGDRVRDSLRVLVATAPDPQRAAAAQEILDTLDGLLSALTTRLG